MVEQAEKEGRLTPPHLATSERPVSHLIEPTSGNTGVGIALVAAVKGYPCTIVMPVKMSKEKETAIKALGAHIVRTPNRDDPDAPDGNIMVAKRLASETAGGIMLDQYNNPNNPDAHYYGTAQEIIDDIETAADVKRAAPSDPPTPPVDAGARGRIDAVVMSAGTGGTVTGVSRRIKEHSPNAVIVGVDPVGSILAQPESLNVRAGEPYQVEGSGYGFIPGVLDRNRVDCWVKNEDEPSFAMVKRLMRTEGMLVGGSSGATMQGALDWLRENPKVAQDSDANVVVLMADSLRNYIGKDWMA